MAHVAFNSTDEIPSEVTKFKMTLTGVCSKYDLKNEIGAGVSTYSTAMININSWRSSTGTFSNVNSYVFLPAMESTIDAKFEFYNESDELVLTRNIENLQMRINARTSVKGAFFQSDGMDADITVDNDWGEPIDIEL